MEGGGVKERKVERVESGEARERVEERERAKEKKG